MAVLLGARMFGLGVTPRAFHSSCTERVIKVCHGSWWPPACFHPWPGAPAPLPPPPTSLSPSSALANSTFSGPCQLARSVARVTFPVTPPRDACHLCRHHLTCHSAGWGVSALPCSVCRVSSGAGHGSQRGRSGFRSLFGRPRTHRGCVDVPETVPRPRKEDGHPQGEQSRQTGWKRCPLALGARISLTRCLWCVPAGGGVPSVCTAFRSRFSAFILWVLGIKPGSPALSAHLPAEPSHLP